MPQFPTPPATLRLLKWHMYGIRSVRKHALAVFAQLAGSAGSEKVNKQSSKEWFLLAWRESQRLFLLEIQQWGRHYRRHGCSRPLIRTIPEGCSEKTSPVRGQGLGSMQNKSSLFSFVGEWAADTITEIPALLAVRWRVRDVAEFRLVVRLVGVVLVNLGEFRIG